MHARMVKDIRFPGMVDSCNTITLLKQALSDRPTCAVHGDVFWTGPLCFSDPSLIHRLKIDAFDIP
jgi:hypothetical protein